MAASGLDGSSIRQKVEIRFEKRPEIRFLSHLDLVRAFHRALRRARIPVRLTQGFNPRPRIVFPAPIEVGTASEDDVAELELAREMSLEDFASILAPLLPQGLGLRGMRVLPCRRRPGRIREIACALDLSGVPWRVPQADADAFLRAPAVPFERRNPDGTGRRTVDLRPAVAGVTVDGARVLVRLRPAPGAFARAIEVLSSIACRPVEELAGVEIVRLRVEMEEA